MQMRRIQRLATVSGAAALLIAGPSAALAQADDAGLGEISERVSAQDDDDAEGSPFGGFGDDDEEPAHDDEDSPFGGFGDDDDEEPEGDDDGGGFEALGVGDDDNDDSDDNPDNPDDGDEDNGASAQFCDEVIANFGDDYAEQCREFAESLGGDNGDNGDDNGADDDDGDPLAEGAQQFCDEVIANLGEDAHEQCLEFAGTPGDGDDDGEPENGADDDFGTEDDFDTEDDGLSADDTGDADGTGDTGALATTGASMGATGLTGLGLLGLGAALLRRFRGGTTVA